MGIMRKKVTILLPAFNEESSFPIICSNMEQVLADNSEYDWEFLMVNDGSTDNTLLQMERLRQIDPEHYCYIDLSRNYGKEIAMMAGFDYATGDAWMPTCSTLLTLFLKCSNIGKKATMTSMLSGRVARSLS